MKYRRLVCVVLGAIALAVAYEARTGEFYGRWSLWTASAPKVDFPSEISVAECEAGEQITVPFAIANRGGRDLIVDSVRTSCSCTGLERLEDGHFVQVGTLRLAPGDV